LHLLPRRTQGSVLYDNVPPVDAGLAARLARYLESREARLLDWLPDGSILIATRFAETGQLHRVAAPLHAREQLTFGGEPVTVARAAPLGGGLAFLEDQGGDEKAQVYYRAADGAVRALTHGAFVHGSPVWAHDGRRLAFSGNDRDGASSDIYVMDATSGAAPQLVVSGAQVPLVPLDWSADDDRLLVLRAAAAGEGTLSIANIATGVLTALDTGGRRVGIRAARFAPDGRGVYVLSDEDGEFARLRLLDPVNHLAKAVTPELEWDVAAFDVSADGRYVAYLVSEDGRGALRLLDSVTHADVTPAGIPDGSVSGIAFDRPGRRLGFAVESPQAPRDVWSFDLASQRLERWTKSEPGPVDPRTFVAPELIRYPTWDRVGGHQRLLPAYVYRPRGAAHCPVLIDIHGGPEQPFSPGWDPFIQFLVKELGMAVIAPTLRGSSGYGKSFAALDGGGLHEEAVRDFGSLLAWVAAQPAFDRARVAVMGSSYGGSLTLEALIAYGERLRGGIDIAGTDNVTLANVSHLKKPLLVVGGRNDPRVPGPEIEQLVWRVRSGGGEVWYLTAQDEGHGWRRKSNRDAYLETAATFLERLSR
ncbi:MAG TPA: prolyl oligopeptidase family serine peptidase, partial [Steroidobacteraceae bacterium]|nr:prolyl oligopeptidase family serine peptidase [Steroidobacteraceae bacterium]